MNILGKEAKASTSKWKLVPNSTKKLTASMAAKATIVAHKSSYKDDSYYVTITIENKYVRFTVDLNCNCNLTEGCQVNPKTFKVFKIEHLEDGTIIERCFAEPL